MRSHFVLLLAVMLLGLGEARPCQAQTEAAVSQGPAALPVEPSPVPNDALGTDTPIEAPVDSPNGQAEQEIASDLADVEPGEPENSEASEAIEADDVPGEAIVDDSTEADGAPTAEASEPTTDSDADPAADPPADWEGLMERAPAFLALTHHAAVHLPIALWLFGAFFVVVGVVVPSVRNQIPAACLIGGAVTSIAAVASGWWYADHEWGEPWDWELGFGQIDWADQLTQHRWVGVALMFASCVLSLLAIISLNRQGWKLAFFWRIGLLALAAAVAWEGHIGGELIHGEGFLEEAFEVWVSPESEE